LNGEDYCESDSMLRNEEGCKASSCCHWNTWEEGEASFNGEGRCWSDIGTEMCTDMSEGCSSHDDCSGDTPFCYSGQCDSCQECHFCHDGIDGTCGPCGDGFPTMEDGPCGEPHEGGQFCMSHSDCQGDTPFCYEYQCDSCAECHFCHDGVDGTCGSCGDGFPTLEDGPCEEGGCPAYCVDEWIGDNICDMYDCDVCDHFTVDGVFDGGDCEGGDDGGDYEGDVCMSHSDCSGDTPFCYESHCDSCAECHYCFDGVDGTCGPCGDGFPLYEDTCGTDGDSDCPSMCIPQWVGDGWCDNGIVYHVDCTNCEHFTDADGVFDGGDCDEEARTSTMVRATKSLEKAVGRSRFSKQEIKSYMSKMAKTRKSAERAVGKRSGRMNKYHGRKSAERAVGKGKKSGRMNSQKWPTRKSAERAVGKKSGRVAKAHAPMQNIGKKQNLVVEEVTGVWSHSNLWIQILAVIGFCAVLKSIYSIFVQKSGDTLYQDLSQEA